MNNKNQKGKTNKIYTHNELEHIVKKWLCRSFSNQAPACDCSFNEIKNKINNEVVDVIGFKQGGLLSGSVLVEVKTSRSDFLVDAKKPHRLDPKSGVGKYRYFATPKGLINIEELPPKWGLIEIDNGRVKYITGHLSGQKYFGTYQDAHLWEFDYNTEAENSLLIMLLNKLSNFDNIEFVKENNRLKSNINNLYDQINKLKKEIQLMRNKKR